MLSASCYINSTVLASIFVYGYNIHLQNSNVILCKIYIYVAFIFAALTPTILILASIDRLLISSQNVDTRLYSSKRLAYFSLSISTFFWIVFNIHTLIKVSIQEYYPSVFICYYDLSSVYVNFVFYSLMVNNGSFCLLMLILSIFAFKNVHHIRRINPRQQRNQIRSMTKKDFQLLRCLYAQDITYICCTLWVNIHYMYSVATKNQIQTPLEQAINQFLNDFFTFLFNTSCCASFFIFISISKAFRLELKRLVFKILGKYPMPVQEEENKQQNIELNVVCVSTIVL